MDAAEQFFLRGRVPDWVPEEDTIDLLEACAPHPPMRVSEKPATTLAVVDFSRTLRRFPIRKMRSQGVGVHRFIIACQCGADWAAPIRGDGELGQQFNKCPDCGRRSCRGVLLLECLGCRHMWRAEEIPVYQGSYDGVDHKHAVCLEQGREKQYVAGSKFRRDPRSYSPENGTA